MNWNSGSEAELKPDLFQVPRFTCYMGNKKAQKASLSILMNCQISQKHNLLSTLGLDRTGHMSFLTGQDRTPEFAGQVLPDRTESGLIFSDILPYK